MSAPVGEVMARGARLARMKEAGVVDPIRFVRSERETRAAIREAEQRRREHLAKLNERRARIASAPHPPHRRSASQAKRGICVYCGGWTPCEEHDYLEDLDFATVARGSIGA